ncbi:MAG: DUF167 domain-containing protein [Rhodoferax sp.]|nr:DUF167 domain-containing protein [Rhodoferax sp.]
MSEALHYRWQGADLWLELQGKPGARRDGFGRVQGGRLQVQIAAPPEDGKATARMLAFLAEAFDVPRAAVLLRYGQASPKKGVTVLGPRRLPPEAAVEAPPAAPEVRPRRT